MQAMRRSERRVKYEQARQIFDKAEYGVLSTAGLEGMPYGVPLSFVLVGNTIYFHSATEGQKLDCIRQEPRVCFTAVSRAETVPEKVSVCYESAVAFGTARILDDEAEQTTALQALYRKYIPSADADQADAYIAKHLARTTVIRMEVEYISGKSSAK